MITLKRVKGSPLTHDELDDNFAGSANLFDDQTIDGVKTFLDSPIVPTPISSDNSTKVATTAFVSSAVGNFVTLDTVQSITGQKEFTSLIKTDGLVSRLSTNGGAYIDVNDGQISIGTGLNNAGAPIPEISIENMGYGMGVVFNPSYGTYFNTNVIFQDGMSSNLINSDKIISPSLEFIISIDGGNLTCDLGKYTNFVRTISTPLQLSFQNIPNSYYGYSGYLLLINSNGSPVTKSTNIKTESNFLTTVSAAGTYIITYVTYNDNVYVTSTTSLS